MDELMHIEVAYARDGGVYLHTCRLPSGSTVADALAASDLERQRPELDMASVAVGIHGRKVACDQVLRDGDRVEIYRPLTIDPMQARRLRARRS